MRAKGHAGMALLITFAILSLLRLTSMESIITALLTVAAVTIPDIDIKLEIKHRKYTHNILAALILGLILALIYHPLGWYIGFTAGFLAVMIHALGDLFTIMPFAPLWPFYRKEISLKWFRYDNPIANNAFLTLGVAMFFTYFLFIYTDTGYMLIDVVREIIRILTTS
ncbi:MAG: hypothetical protein DRJ66_02615 [Thermoprotei archaeon]|nr:MAG: hypothetical protein DRJ66_02615 [Thermoprotei archaeon]RLF19627.1 MAG: hypothetical protein DRZ82_05135 [Thermoprotei archaeon]